VTSPLWVLQAAPVVFPISTCLLEGTRLVLEDLDMETALLRCGSRWYTCHVDELINLSQAAFRCRGRVCV